MFSRSLKNCLNIMDLRERAKRKLPAAMFGFLDGFAEDGVTGGRNRSDFDSWLLVPKMLAGVSNPNTAVNVLGTDMPMPFMLGPSSMSRLFHYKGEDAVAGAAAARGITYCMAALGSTTIEDIAARGGSHWFQYYIFGNGRRNKEFLDRARDAGCTTLVLTVDANFMGNREDDIRNGFVVPPRPSLGTIIEAARHPEWCWNLVTKSTVDLANMRGSADALKKESVPFKDYDAAQMHQAIDWTHVAEIRALWEGPMLLKGILHPDDAAQAQAAGVQGIVISNHGGRQLDHTPSALMMLPDIRKRVGPDMTLIVDGGFRRATDIIKAMALGANAVMLGRAYLYGLAAGGEEGVLRAITLLENELILAMRLLGCKSVSDLDATFLRPAAPACD